MIAESKRIEFWNFLTNEKNQPRPKGITIQRLAVIKTEIVGSEELWENVIEHCGAGIRPASEFYLSKESASIKSRAIFWEAVRTLISQEENKRNKENKPLKTKENSYSKSTSRNRQKRRSTKN